MLLVPQEAQTAKSIWAVCFVPLVISSSVQCVKLKHDDHILGKLIVKTG